MLRDSIGRETVAIVRQGGARQPLANSRQRREGLPAKVGRLTRPDQPGRDADGHVDGNQNELERNRPPRLHAGGLRHAQAHDQVDAEIHREQNQAVQEDRGKARPKPGIIQFANTDRRAFSQFLHEDRFAIGADVSLAMTNHVLGRKQIAAFGTDGFRAGPDGGTGGGGRRSG